MTGTRRAIGACLAGALACAHGAGSTSTSKPVTAPTATETATPPQTPGPTPTAPPDPTPADAEERLASIRAEVEALLTAQGSAVWELWTKGKLPGAEAALEASASLTSPETLAFVGTERDRASGDARRALGLLHGFLVGEHLSRATAAARPAVVPAVPWDGAAVPLARVPTLLATEPDAGRRAALQRAWAEAARRAARADAPRWEAMSGAARALGYPSLLALAAELRGEEPEALVALAEAVLHATDAPYRALLEALSRLELGRPVTELRGADLPRLLRAGDDARAFPAAKAGGVHDLLTRLGLGLAGREGVVLDGEARAGKDPRALALPVQVPGSVRVATTPASGAAELRAVLHELGAATFYAHVAVPELEFRRLGAVTAETWATLFEDLAGDPAWLSARTGFTDEHLAPLVRASEARRLHQARALAARVVLEVMRARDPARAAAAGLPTLRWAFGRVVEQDELDLFLSERDPLLESADALRAVLLAAQAEAHLSARAAGPWWSSPASGERLRELFADGSRLAPAELARALGASGLEAGAFAAAARSRAVAAGLRVAGDTR